MLPFLLLKRLARFFTHYVETKYMIFRETLLVPHPILITIEVDSLKNAGILNPPHLSFLKPHLFPK